MWGKINKLIITIILVLLTSVPVMASVDVLFLPATTNVERNSYLTMGIIASADTTTEITAIDANFSFDPAVFNGPSIQSSITGWPQSVEQIGYGYITYQKNNVGQDAYHFDVSAGATRNVYSVTFKVASNAGLGATVMNFDTQGFLNIIEGITNVTGTHNQAEITILPDTTPPQTSASKASGLYNYTFSVTLYAVDQYDDLNRIHYTTNGVTPSIFSPVYSGPISILQDTTTVLKFFGVDNYGNLEEVKVRTYAVDTTAPVVAGLVVTPNFVRSGETISISFTVNEPLLNAPTVKIGSISATAYDLSYPSYDW